MITMALVVLAGSMPFAGTAYAKPAPASSGVAPDRSVPVTAAAARKPSPPTESQTNVWRAPQVRWPAVGQAEVTLDAGDSAVPGQPVRVAPVLADASGRAAASPVERVSSTVVSRERARAAGVDGLMVALRRADERGGQGRVSVEIDYSGVGQAFGADYERRLGLVRLPACALATPATQQCRTGTAVPSRNDLAGSRLTAEVGVAADEDTVLVVTAAAASADTGTFARSSLSSAASWSVGHQSGEFAWSYPIEVPPAPGDLEPDIAIEYSSGSVDGRTNVENAQPSWIGEGWDYQPGFIERQYRACRDDITGATPAQYANATEDLCWRDQNATLSWNGKSSELVLDDATGKWRLADDDGSRVELVTGGEGTQNYNNEHWKLTTTDGTQYWFGKSRLPGWQTGNPSTSSVWGAPVFANRTGEPCYQSTGFANSWCSMGWRWSLDYVVDPHGNSMSYWYKKETSTTKLAGGSAVRGYDRGGHLLRIEYGTRTGTEYTAAAPMKVEFTVSDRCVATSCRSGTAPVTANWPDTPWFLHCTAAPCNNNVSPSFWTEVRLTKIVDVADLTFADSTLPNFCVLLRASLPARASLTVCRPGPMTRWLLERREWGRF